LRKREREKERERFGLQRLIGPLDEKQTRQRDKFMLFVPVTGLWMSALGVVG
jgi:hypothetical protein